MHNVIGVMSLPLTLMYAFSGLVFNLAIIYQIAFAVVLYQGDQQALLDDGGYKQVTAKWTGKPWQNPEIDRLYQEATVKYEKIPRVIRAYNYGDENAVIHFFITEPISMTKNYEVAYNLKDNTTYLKRDLDNPNSLRQGLYVISKLHFGNYAGFDLRVLYFILSMGVCALIVTGNLLWIEKRRRQRNHQPKTLAFVSNFTLWSTGGVIASTAVAFLIERLLPSNLEARADYMITSFIVTLVLVAILLVFNKNKIAFLGRLLSVSGYIAFIVIMIDWIMFTPEITHLWSQGVTTIIGTQIGLAIMGTLLVFIGCKLTYKVDVQSKNIAV